MALSRSDPIVENCPQALTDAHRRQYDELGYVAFEQVLTPAEVEAARAALTAVTGDLMQALRQGRAEVRAAPPDARRNYAGPQVRSPGEGPACQFEAGVDPLRHHHTVDCEILPDRIDPARAVPVELAAGGVIYFSALLPHQTPPNRSPRRRRALQFQYRARSCRQVPPQEFGRVFAEADGRPASCALAYETG